jgi:crotonobetainyl-CoA:carnitine CoA-transferase CaiB-like acyl-CoA transferase
LLDHPELQTAVGRVANADRVDEVMRPWLMAHTADECFHTGQAWRIPFSLVPDAAAICASPQHDERGYFTDIAHPEAGSYRAPGPAFYPSDGTRSADRAAPALGRDNTEVYGALGLQPEEIAVLRERGTI